MKFRSIPQEIEAVQFTEDAVFPKGVTIRTVADLFEVFNPLHGSWIGVKKGDWIRTDNLKDVYPITDAYMKSKYRAVE